MRYNHAQTTASITSLIPNTPTAGGLHTLVDGLTISSELSNSDSPPPSPSPSAASAFAPSSASETLMPPAPASTSIFNNPSMRSPASPSTGPATPTRTGGEESPGKIALPISMFGGVKSNDAAVKEVDDPTGTPLSLSDKRSSLMADSPLRFFTGANSPGPSSQLRSSPGYRDSLKLEDFLYQRGFLEGICSDVTIIAFGIHYRLHRLILDRSPFFSAIFNGAPWIESTSKEITLSPETSDPNIVQHAFELTLARLYGRVDREEEDRHALPLLAAASYLELQDFAESCAASLLRGLKTSNVAQIISFVSNSYYGPFTERLLGAAKALFCRDGWELPLTEWDGINGQIAADIAGYEGFYVPTEYARYVFVRDLINHRIQITMEGAGVDHGSDDNLDTSVFDESYLKPLQDLLETGIYYVHMSFEELQRISSDRDCLGRPTVSERTIQGALWQQMLLRQKVVNAPIDHIKLGVTTVEQPQGQLEPSSELPTQKFPGNSVAGQIACVLPEYTTTGERKYYIPTEDSTTVIGDCPDQPPQVIVSQRGLPRNAATLTNTSVPTALGKESELSTAPTPGEFKCYSQFPPFRFSAEFRGVKSLKEKKRVYSKTVFYAGSYWNIYIQKVKSKNVQLGVYLHRAKDREGSGSSSAHRDGEVTQIATLDERGNLIDRTPKRDLDGGEDTVSSLLDGADVTSTTINSLISQGRQGAAANTSAVRTTPSRNVETVPAIGHYVDHRPTIETYFKIFSPSRKGKMLSMFSSGPDSFNFSQSWGWKSSSLILEEGGLMGDNEKDSRLRFMVVLGNV
ncbi:hypothetical protein EX30DRAFT_321084 [Ascodesmis nigricans]|uniref:BTB domain-containing protein n=1 Tax=Ascodesmis nigricans TaxID=341454 RepID=A0A4S2MQN0_9PEZI|nr:hypothetical protein EX30DRAFT_321084 [Ascodesmis nigricans]